MARSLPSFRALLMVAAMALMTLGVAVASSIPAHAADKNFTCTNQGGGPNHKVVCIGNVSGNDITVEVSDVRVLNDNEISILEDSLDKAVIKLVDLDVQLRVNKLAVEVVEIFDNKLNIDITICQVKVVEAGVVNTNIAKC